MGEKIGMCIIIAGLSIFMIGCCIITTTPMVMNIGGITVGIGLSVWGISSVLKS